MKKLLPLYLIFLSYTVNSQVNFNNFSIKEFETLNKPFYKTRYTALEYKVKGDSLLVLEYFSDYDYYDNLDRDKIFSNIDTLYSVTLYTGQQQFSLSKSDKEWEVQSWCNYPDTVNANAIIRFPSFPCRTGDLVGLPCNMYEYYGYLNGGKSDSISRHWTLMKFNEDSYKALKAGAKKIITNFGLCVANEFTVYSISENRNIELTDDVKIERFDIKFDNVSNDDFNIKNYEIHKCTDENGNAYQIFKRSKRTKN